MQLTRRCFTLPTLGASLVRPAIGLVAGPAVIGRAAAQTRRWPNGDPFSLGVASGAPRPDGFVLWTRLGPDPLSANPATPGGVTGGDVPVGYEIARDEAMRDIVRRGVADAEAAYGWSVHADIAGLQPGRPYWYRFLSEDAVSPVGRAMTTVAAGMPVERMRFGFVSCSHYEFGYFSAYRHIADENPDMVLFLGDYITRPPSKAASALIATVWKPRRCQPTATAMRSTGSMPTCSVFTPGRRRSSPGMTMKFPTIMPTNGRNITMIQSCSYAAAPPPIRRSTNTCRCGRSCRARKGRLCASTIGSPSATSSKSR